MRSRIEIKGDGAFTEIFIDGHKINGVRAWELSHGAGNIPILKIDMNALDLDVDARILKYDKNSLRGFDIVWLDTKLPEADTQTVNGEEY